MMDLIIIMPITAALSVVFLLLLKIYLKLREFFPVSVECWFCCKKTSVLFGDANSWDCLSCNQYNGFLEDGDYNRLMPAQYDELLNVPRFTSNAREQHNGMRSSPTLCANCNNNQQMKIAQLAMFMPLNPKNYDLEIEKYSEQLERIYGICSSCEATVTEVFKKQNKLYGLKSPNSERKQSLSKVQPVIAVKRPLLFTHYATLLLGAVLFYSSTRNSSQFVSLENFIIDQLHKFMKLLPNSAFLEERLQFITLLMANNVYRFYTWIPSSLADRLTYSMDHFIIGALILISVLELSRVRNTISLLNTGTWIILLSLNVSSTAPQYLISLMQAMVSVVFIYISIGSLRMERKIRMKTKMRKGKMKKQVPKKSNETIKTNAPSCSTVDNSKMKITRDNEPLISKPTTAKSASSVHSAKMLNNPLKDSSKPSRSHIEFGLSDLSLGPSSESGSIRNHLNSEPRPYCGRLNDQIWSRSTVLSPSRLNMDTVDSPFTTSASPPRSQRSLNESSGRGSIVSNQESVCGERIYDKFSPNNKLTVANQPLTHQNYYDLYPSSEFSYPAMTHYQFTSQLQRRYSSSPPNSTIFLNNSPPSNSMLPYMPLPFYPSFHQFQSTPTHPPTDAHSKNSFFHSIVFPALVVVLVACNLSLLGLVYYREISMKNT